MFLLAVVLAACRHDVQILDVGDMVGVEDVVDGGGKFTTSSSPKSPRCQNATASRMFWPGLVIRSHAPRI
jgi:hypothetical protein